MDRWMTTHRRTRFPLAWLVGVLMIVVSCSEKVLPDSDGSDESLTMTQASDLVRRAEPLIAELSDLVAGEYGSSGDERPPASEEERLSKVAIDFGSLLAEVRPVTLESHTLLLLDEVLTEYHGIALSLVNAGDQNSEIGAVVRNQLVETGAKWQFAVAEAAQDPSGAPTSTTPIGPAAEDQSP